MQLEMILDYWSSGPLPSAGIMGLCHHGALSGAGDQTQDSVHVSQLSPYVIVPLLGICPKVVLLGLEVDS